MANNKSKFKATDKGFKEVEIEELKKTVPSKEEEKEIEKLSAEQEKEEEEDEGAKVDLADDLTVPYPELGHTVSQLSAFPEHKRQAILGGKDKEFCKKYHL